MSRTLLLVLLSCTAVCVALSQTEQPDTDRYLFHSAWSYGNTYTTKTVNALFAPFSTYVIGDSAASPKLDEILNLLKSRNETGLYELMLSLKADLANSTAAAQIMNDNVVAVNASVHRHREEFLAFQTRIEAAVKNIDDNTKPEVEMPSMWRWIAIAQFTFFLAYIPFRWYFNLKGISWGLVPFSKLILPMVGLSLVHKANVFIYTWAPSGLASFFSDVTFYSEIGVAVLVTFCGDPLATHLFGFFKCERNEPAPAAAVATALVPAVPSVSPDELVKLAADEIMRRFNSQTAHTPRVVGTQYDAPVLYITAPAPAPTPSLKLEADNIPDWRIPLSTRTHLLNP